MCSSHPAGSLCPRRVAGGGGVGGQLGGWGVGGAVQPSKLLRHCSLQQPTKTLSSEALGRPGGLVGLKSWQVILVRSQDYTRNPKEDSSQKVSVSEHRETQHRPHHCKLRLLSPERGQGDTLPACFSPLAQSCILLARMRGLVNVRRVVRRQSPSPQILLGSASNSLGVKTRAGKNGFVKQGK